MRGGVQQGAHVEPGEVGAFEAGEGQQGEGCLELLAEGAVVVVDVGHELVEPRCAFRSVGGLQGYGGEDVDVAGLVVVDGAVDAAAHGGVGADDIGGLEACDVEGFVGCIGHDPTAAYFLGNGGEGDVGTTELGGDELAVDLVGEDDDIGALADLCHLAQLLGGPYPAGGVVGIAEEEEADVAGTDGFLKGLEVDCAGLGLGVPGQGEVHEGAVGIADAAEEAVVGGGEGQHGIALAAETLEDGADGGDDTAGVLDPLAGEVPVVTGAVPPTNGIVEAVGHEAVAVDGVGGAALDGVGNAGCCLEVHVGDPQGEDIVGGHLIPFDAVGAEAGGQFVKIHGCISRFSIFYSSFASDAVGI